MRLTVPKGEILSALTIHAAIEAVNKAHYSANPLSMNNWDIKSPRVVVFTLRVADSKQAPARRSANGRRTIGADWQAHKRVMAELFERVPTLTLKTALATYKGKADFWANHAATYHKNVGGKFNPTEFGSL